MPVPVAAQVSASVRFFWKYELVAERGGINMVPRPRPTHSPWDRKKCQYCDPRLAMNVPNTTRKAPAINVDPMYPASAKRPEKAHMP